MTEISLENQNDHIFLMGKLEKFEGKSAVINLDGGQSVNWPIAQLPANAEIGTTIRLKLLTESSEEVEREKIAKTILNEILKEK
ncbi:MAG: hypothetical protein WCX71_04795 [Candidatus Buchananbacteria bacterium]